jgi:hypothetical protein
LDQRSRYKRGQLSVGRRLPVISATTLAFSTPIDACWLVLIHFQISDCSDGADGDGEDFGEGDKLGS